MWVQFFINDKETFLPENQLRNSPNCTIWDSWAFQSFILADEPFVKILQSLETCVAVNISLCGMLVSSLESPIMRDAKLNNILYLLQY